MSGLYPSRLFAAELLYELERGLFEAEPSFSITRLSRWAYSKQLKYAGKMELGLDDRIMEVVLMEEGPEFELTVDQIRALAKAMI